MKIFGISKVSISITLGLLVYLGSFVYIVKSTSAQTCAGSGYVYNGRCWYMANFQETCDSACSRINSSLICDSTTEWDDTATTCQIANHFLSLQSKSCSSCTTFSTPYYPAVKMSDNTCYYRGSGQQTFSFVCGYPQSGGWAGIGSGLTKLCVCKANPATIPDLTVEDIVRTSAHYEAYICNRGQGVGSGTFTILTENTGTGASYQSNPYYPYTVPQPGSCVWTGGLTCSFVGQSDCLGSETIRFTVDDTNQVVESNESNNSFTKTFSGPTTIPTKTPTPTPLPVCDNKTCSTGCCTKYTQGSCLAGTDNTACGKNGNTCQPCATGGGLGSVCVNQVCSNPPVTKTPPAPVGPCGVEQEDKSGMVINPSLGGVLSGATGIGYFKCLLPGLIGLGFVVGAVAFVLMMVVGGIQMILSGGDKMAVEAARSRVTHAAIGLIVLLSTLAITMFFQTAFGVHILTLDLGLYKFQ